MHFIIKVKHFIYFFPPVDQHDYYLISGDGETAVIFQRKRYFSLSTNTDNLSGEAHVDFLNLLIKPNKDGGRK